MWLVKPDPIDVGTYPTIYVQDRPVTGDLTGHVTGDRS